MVAKRWGTIPKVQPSAANTIAECPCFNAVDMVKSTPVPGIKQIIKAVMINSIEIMRVSL